MNRHKNPPPDKSVFPTPSSPSLILSNSFARLSLPSTEGEREGKLSVLRATNKAHTALYYSSDPYPIELQGSRKDVVAANAAYNEACYACTPFPNVNPPSKEYFIDPFEESVMDTDELVEEL